MLNFFWRNMSLDFLSVPRSAQISTIWEEQICDMYFLRLIFLPCSTFFVNFTCTFLSTGTLTSTVCHCGRRDPFIGVGTALYARNIKN
jgi:hypothetical protein